MVDTRDLKSLGGNAVRVRVPSPAPLRNDLCMSGSCAGRARLDSKGLSSFKPAIASLDCGFVLQNWQLSYSVHMTKLVASVISLATSFYVSSGVYLKIHDVTCCPGALGVFRYTLSILCAFRRNTGWRCQKADSKIKCARTASAVDALSIVQSCIVPALPRLMQSTQILAISMSVQPSFVYSIEKCFLNTVYGCGAESRHGIAGAFGYQPFTRFHCSAPSIAVRCMWKRTVSPGSIYLSEPSARAAGRPSG